MLRVFGKVSLGLVVTLALAAACGSNDDKKRNQGDEAGAGGQAGTPEASVGGGKSEAGEAPLPSAGQGGQAPLATGGAGGEPPLEPMGGAGGEPPQTACCQPLTCDDVDFECGYTNDGCGDYVVCECPSGTQCGQGALCVECTPSPTICENRCGQILDNCNTPTNCGDTCSENNPGDVCSSEGYCCSPVTECADGVCGVVSDTCGGTVDCGNCEGSQVCVGNSCCSPNTSCDGLCGKVDDGCGGELDCTGTPCEEGECQPNGACCTPLADVCSGLNCDVVPDGCGNFVQCGEACTGTKACLDNACKESVCKAQGLNCGSVSNSEVVGGYESCGSCAREEVCSPENLCLPICD